MPMTAEAFHITDSGIENMSVLFGNSRLQDWEALGRYAVHAFYKARRKTKSEFIGHEIKLQT